MSEISRDMIRDINMAIDLYGKGILEDAGVSEQQWQNIISGQNTDPDLLLLRITNRLGNRYTDMLRAQFATHPAITPSAPSPAQQSNIPLEKRFTLAVEELMGLEIIGKQVPLQDWLKIKSGVVTPNSQKALGKMLECVSKASADLGFSADDMKSLRQLAGENTPQK